MDSNNKQHGGTPDDVICWPALSICGHVNCSMVWQNSSMAVWHQTIKRESLTNIRSLIEIIAAQQIHFSRRLR